jgi:uncharacterized protein YkwD
LRPRTVPLVVALLSALALPATAPAAGDCMPDPSWPASRADLAAQALALVNAHRAELGAPALVASPTLSAAAEWKARHMAAYGYLSHDDPAPPAARSAGERIAACGYPGEGWGENIASGYATPAAAVAGWLTSGAHRANLEDATFTATGVGAAAGASGTYWVQVFGSVIDARVATVQPAPPSPAAPGSATVAAPAKAAVAPARVSCGRARGHLACDVRLAAAARVRLALVRAHRTWARARARQVPARATAHMRLHRLRRLRPGRYSVIVRVASAAGQRTQLAALVLR